MIPCPTDVMYGAKDLNELALLDRIKAWRRDIGGVYTDLGRSLNIGTHLQRLLVVYPPYSFELRHDNNGRFRRGIASVVIIHAWMLSSHAAQQSWKRGF